MTDFERITDVSFDGADKLRVRFASGARRTINLRSYAEMGGVFVRLVDPQYAAKVKIAENGRVLRWLGELDFCADAIFLAGNRQTEHPSGGSSSRKPVEAPSKRR